MKAMELSLEISKFYSKHKHLPSCIFLTEEEFIVLTRSQNLDQTYDRLDVIEFRAGKTKFDGIPIRPFGRDAGFKRFEMSEETKKNLVSLYMETLNAKIQNDL